MRAVKTVLGRGVFVLVDRIACHDLVAVNEPVVCFACHRVTAIRFSGDHVGNPRGEFTATVEHGVLVTDFHEPVVRAAEIIALLHPERDNASGKHLVRVSPHMIPFIPRCEAINPPLESVTVGEGTWGIIVGEVTIPGDIVEETESHNVGGIGGARRVEAGGGTDLIQ